MRTNAGDTTAVNGITNRGYTGHEMDDEVGLTNMNARIYDPYLGRFLSPDPVLPDASDMQSFNRYAYVINNPLKYVDPTGNIPTIVVTAPAIGGGSTNGLTTTHFNISVASFIASLNQLVSQLIEEGIIDNPVEETDGMDNMMNQLEEITVTAERLEGNSEQNSNQFNDHIFFGFDVLGLLPVVTTTALTENGIPEITHRFDENGNPIGSDFSQRGQRLPMPPSLNFRRGQPTFFEALIPLHVSGLSNESAFTRQEAELILQSRMNAIRGGVAVLEIASVGLSAQKAAGLINVSRQGVVNCAVAVVFCRAMIDPTNAASLNRLVRQREQINNAVRNGRNTAIIRSQATSN